MSKKLSSLVIVGTGLLGSSIGLAVKKRNLADTVLGIGHCSATLETALRRGAVDRISTDFAPLSAMDDALVLICTPVGVIVELAEKIAAVNSNILISDVGSTKENICRQLAQKHYRFIGGHPIAGSEKTGPEFGNPDMFQGRLVLLTPGDTACQNDINRLKTFWESLDAKTMCIESALHDAILARTSHLPHLTAFLLVSLLRSTDHPFCGQGFADSTRIAAGSTEIWTDIFLDNQKHLLAALDEFCGHLDVLKSALRQGDAAAVSQFLESARKNKADSAT